MGTSNEVARKKKKKEEGEEEVRMHVQLLCKI